MAVILVLLACLGIAASAAGAARAPKGFLGVAAQGDLTGRDFGRMEGTVSTVRIPIYWMNCEPRPHDYDFADLDGVVGAAADHGIRVLPFVYGSPSWAEPEPSRPPLSPGDLRAWSRFLRVLVHRYGPAGDFWEGRDRRVPIHRWQLWNEPNFPVFWAPRPSPRGYARLLAVGSRAVRDADPDARVVLAGLAPIENEPPPWEYLRSLYEVPGAARNFDIVALHPYSASLDSLEYQVQQTRATMIFSGHRRTPLEITEFGVASGGSRPSPMIKSPAGQAAYLRRAFDLLLERRKEWRLSGADWFTWRDSTGEDPYCVFCQRAGLFDLADEPKPAWRAFRRVAAMATQ